jgi:hypothetical protein
MAKTDRKRRSRLIEAIGDKELNPLGRLQGTLSKRHGTRARSEAELAMHCTGIHALARLLANSETLRDVQANSESVTPGHWPLNGHITDGLFTALLVLSERAEMLSQSLPDKSGAKRPGKRP